MSLFSGYDVEAVPLLTQIFQIDLPTNWGGSPEQLEESELRAFWFRADGRPHPSLPIRWHGVDWITRRIGRNHLEPAGAGVWHDPWKQLLIIQTEQRASFGRSLLLLAEVHALAREGLAVAADGSEIPPRLLVRVAALIQEHVELLILVNDPRLPWTSLRPEQLPKDVEGIPRQWLRLAATGKEELPHVAARILLELRQVLGAGNSARRCSECGKPFVLLRPDQRYCSHRCGNTAGSRRRRQEKKENGITLAKGDGRSILTPV